MNILNEYVVNNFNMLFSLKDLIEAKIWDLAGFNKFSSRVFDPFQGQ